MSQVACHVERLVDGARERATQIVGNERYPDAPDLPLLPAGTATIDGIRPGEGVTGNRAVESNRLTTHRHGCKGHIDADQGSREAHDDS